MAVGLGRDGEALRDDIVSVSQLCEKMEASRGSPRWYRTGNLYERKIPIFPPKFPPYRSSISGARIENGLLVMKMYSEKYAQCITKRG